MRSLICLSLLLMSVLCTSAQQWGLVSIPVSCMREEPTHTAEQSTQAVVGTPVRILDKISDWYKVRLPDGYVGFMRENTLCLLTDEQYSIWLSSPKLIVTEWLAPLVNGEGKQISYATFGSLLVAYGNDGGFFHVKMPDGTMALLDCNHACPIDQWQSLCKGHDIEDVIELALTMLGAPYLWGGTSTLAPDCSGFTQIAFSTLGWLLPRDTSQQIKTGSPVTSLDKSRRGDLIFFGNRGRVNHVAIYLGDGKILHSSGHVRVCRLNDSVPGDEDVYPFEPMAIRRLEVNGNATPHGVKDFFSSIINTK